MLDGQVSVLADKHTREWHVLMNTSRLEGHKLMVDSARSECLFMASTLSS